MYISNIMNMGKVLIIINDAPYGTEKAYNALRLGMQIQKDFEGTEVCVFLMGILKPNGKLGIVHWRSDIETPRGPDITIRPNPDQILQWIDRQRFSLLKEPALIEPYHFGLILFKNEPVILRLNSISK